MALVFGEVEEYFFSPELSAEGIFTKSGKHSSDKSRYV